MCVGLVFVALLTDPSSKLYGGRPIPVWLALAVVYVALSYTLNRQVALVFNGVVTMSRNFYGVLTIVRYDEGTPDERLTLRNGMIDHGMQFTAPDKTRLPVTYYSSQSGLGIMFRNFPRQTERRVGLVGLGAGVVATYARRGDTLKVYEINPQVTVLAREWFSYLDESPAEIEIVHGDARLSLEREPPQRFDILVLDAFSGDAIPVHLLTEEAFTIYERHIADSGVIAIHLSNRHMNFAPVVRQHGDMLGLETLLISNLSGPNEVWRSDWMLLTNNQQLLQSASLRDRATPAVRKPVRPWTDDYANIFEILRLPWKK